MGSKDRPKEIKKKKAPKADRKAADLTPTVRVVPPSVVPRRERHEKAPEPAVETAAEE